MANIDSLVSYYANLLILQYKNLPKSSATIELLATTLLANGVATDVAAAYNIDPELGPTAVGKQLDVLGKYIGVTRYYSSINYGDYFAVVPYGVALPGSPPAFGFDTYAAFPDSYDYNGTLLYSDIITSTNSLSDTQYITLLQLGILNNNSNYSFGQISEDMFSIFGNSIVPETNGNMAISFFIRAPLTTLLQAVIAKGLLPRPMGVSCVAVTDLATNTFSFGDYRDYESPWGYGFSTYSNYDTLAGQTLEYSNIQRA